MAVSRIWWIASYPKSGNTWVRLLLTAYRDKGLDKLTGTHKRGETDIPPYVYQSVAAVPLEKLGRFEVAMLRPAVIHHLAVKNSGDALWLKTHHANVALEGFPLFTRHFASGAVYCVRDPRDVAVSYAHHRGVDVNEIIPFMSQENAVANNPDHSLFHWLGSWSTHVKSWTLADSFPVHVVRYEDLQADTRGEFKKICEFLNDPNQPVKEDRLWTAVEATRFSRLQKMERGQGFEEAPEGRRFFRSGQPGEWRDVLTDRQVAAIESEHGEQMREMGYELVSQPKLVTA